MISSERLKVACERAEMRAKCHGISDKPGDFGIRSSEWPALLRELEARRANDVRGIGIGMLVVVLPALLALTLWGWLP